MVVLCVVVAMGVVAAATAVGSDPSAGPGTTSQGSVDAEAAGTDSERSDLDEPDPDDAGPEPPRSGAEESGAEATGDEAVLEVIAFDVGQGDATLVRSGDATVLVDTGRHDRDDVVGHLDAAGIDTLDLVVITHPHADHIGQLDAVLEGLDVAEVWFSGAVHTTATFERAVAAVEASDAAYGEPRGGDVADIGPLTVEVLNPDEDIALDDLHDSGLVVRISAAGASVLLTGDAEAVTEARLVDRRPDLLAADLYRVGHHGSTTSTSPGFLAAVDPQIAVWSASATNSYGHPHDEVIDRLDAAGIEVWGTALHGTITAVGSDGEWTVHGGEAP